MKTDELVMAADGAIADLVSALRDSEARCEKLRGDLEDARRNCRTLRLELYEARHRWWHWIFGW